MRLYISLLLLLPFTCFAACDQESIQFYLDKGFNQEQITKLCTTTASETYNYQPYQKPVVIVQEGYASNGISAENSKAENTLRGGLNARSVDVTPQDVSYIRKVCVEWKESPNVESWINKCVDVAFSVSRDNLKVNDSSASLLFVGQQQVEITSDSIKRKHVTSDPWAEFTPDVKFLLERKYKVMEQGNSTILPLRNTADPSQIVNAIRTLADSTKANSEKVTSSEVARVLDNSYVPPTEEEYLASQPTLKEIEAGKKDNKKWWNPFD